MSPSSPNSFLVLPTSPITKTCQVYLLNGFGSLYSSLPDQAFSCLYFHHYPNHLQQRCHSSAYHALQHPAPSEQSRAWTAFCSASTHLELYVPSSYVLGSLFCLCSLSYLTPLPRDQEHLADPGWTQCSALSSLVYLWGALPHPRPLASSSVRHSALGNVG